MKSVYSPVPRVQLPTLRVLVNFWGHACALQNGLHTHARVKAATENRLMVLKIRTHIRQRYKIVAYLYLVVKNTFLFTQTRFGISR